MVLSAGKTNLPVAIINISTQGCRIRGVEIPDVGQKGELVIEWQGKTFRCATIARWENARREVGLEFLTMDEKRLAVLRGLLATLSLEPSRPLRPGRSAKTRKQGRRKER